jgi:hypothetical protein
MEERTPIPESTKRAVRQAAGFGCCKCGLPIFQYHHILPRSANPDDIMALCPTDHFEATARAMTVEEQRAYQARPFNIEQGYVEGQLKINQTDPVVLIGTNRFVGQGDKFVVDGESLLSVGIDAGKLVLSLKMYDPRDILIADIEKNEWISGDPMPWDLESSYQWLRIRHKLGQIGLDIDAREEPIQLKADLWRKGQHFSLSPSRIEFNGFDGRMRGIAFQDSTFIGASLVVDTAAGQFSIGSGK